jgi:hypothetical protein
LSSEPFIGLTRNQTWGHPPLSLDLLTVLSGVQVERYSGHMAFPHNHQVDMAVC